MNRHLLVSVAAVAMLGFGLQGCSKKDSTATTNAADSTATTTTTATTNTAGATGNAMGGAGSATGNAVGSAEGSHPVSDVQDAAAGPVGLASAATLGARSTGAFVTNAAMGDMYEIQAAKMAEAKSTSPEIKTFAKRMIKDHTKTTTELKGIVAQGVKATLPTALDQRRQGMLDNLKTSASGQEFDKRYVSQQVAAHQEMETLMKGFAQHGDNDALKAFAAKTAPVVQMHLDMAKAIHAMPDASSKAAG